MSLLLQVTVKQQSSHHCLSGFIGMSGNWSVWRLLCVSKSYHKKSTGQTPETNMLYVNYTPLKTKKESSGLGFNPFLAEGGTQVTM